MGALRLHRRAGPARHRLLHLHRRHGSPLLQGSGEPAAASARRGLHRQGGQQCAACGGAVDLTVENPNARCPFCGTTVYPTATDQAALLALAVRAPGPRGRPRHPLHRPQPRPLVRRRRDGRGHLVDAVDHLPRRARHLPLHRVHLPLPGWPARSGPDGHHAARRRRPRGHRRLPPRHLGARLRPRARALSPAPDPPRPRAGPRAARRERRRRPPPRLRLARRPLGRRRHRRHLQRHRQRDRLAHRPLVARLHPRRPARLPRRRPRPPHEARRPLLLRPPPPPRRRRPGDPAAHEIRGGNYGVIVSNGGVHLTHPDSDPRAIQPATVAWLLERAAAVAGA